MNNYWRFGTNYIPRTAINQLEMWQADSFDPATIDQEFEWAENIGMSLMRVYLHDLLWEDDSAGFLSRINQYLSIADKHNIKTMFVIFDDCHRSEFKLGKQPDPKPFIHNSGWVQSPGPKVVDNPGEWGRLEKYVKGILSHFKDDDRILAWDLYNEPGNGASGDHLNKGGFRADLSLPLLKKVFSWAREVNPVHPLTCAAWRFDEDFFSLNQFSIENSDIVSFHDYENPEILKMKIHFIKLLAKDKPVICSEYMARTNGSTFKDCLPILKENNISAINWGFVVGKSNTIYPWGWNESKGKPDLYFHDVLDTDGKFLYPEEKEVFQSVQS